MATTTNMLLTLPTVSTTVGPTWANNINTALEAVDAHDHTSDKGARITPAALNINSNLDIENNIFYNFQAIRFQQRDTSLTGSANANSIYSVGGNLYFTNGSGTAVQMTSGGSLVSSPASADSFEPTSVSTNLTIGSSDTYVYLFVNTTSSRTITLPQAAAVSAGRIYIVKDISGQANTNPITISRSGSDTVDGATSKTLNSDYGSWQIVGDGTSAWYIS